MSAPAVINYREAFPIPDLTRIIGIPTFETLHQMANELKQNASSVYSNLGGGAHGHLGLILSPQMYALISNVPYVRPGHPGTLIIPPNATRQASALQERTWKEELRVFHEVRGVEQALIAQIVNAVEESYLLSVRNRTTGQYTGNVGEILRHLQGRYGRITPGQLQEFDLEITQMTYDPVNPIEQVFNRIEDLVDYGEIASNAYTQNQAISKAYNILNKTGVFKEYIKTWKRRPAVEHTWINFKEHFRQGHDELQETDDLTLQNAGYGSANLVDEIVNHVTNDIQAHLNVIQGPPPSLPPPPVTPDPTPEPAAQHVTTDAMVNQLIQQNQEMMRILVAATNNRNNRRRPRPSTGPRPGQPTRPLPARINKYCWTHGRCNHTSNSCESKAPGHQNEATMENKIGGSTYGCIPAST